MIIGVGTDLVNMERLLPKQEDLAKKILTENEYATYKTLSTHRKIEFLGGHFAAKEALVKAMPADSLISDFEIYYKDNKPCVDIKGYKAHISIAHDGMLANAIAIIESRD
ncbi:MAG: holo-ACP synthase [Erysipelotrichaceae bacterium]|nr:holo-ACP synthase [Erysipelotrichaceae bacterium]